MTAERHVLSVDCFHSPPRPTLQGCGDFQNLIHTSAIKARCLVTTRLHVVAAGNAQHETDSQHPYQPGSDTYNCFSTLPHNLLVYRKNAPELCRRQLTHESHDDRLRRHSLAESRIQECPPFCCSSGPVLQRKLYSNPCNPRCSSIHSSGHRVQVDHGNAVPQGPNHPERDLPCYFCVYLRVQSQRTHHYQSPNVLDILDAVK